MGYCTKCKRSWAEPQEDSAHNCLEGTIANLREELEVAKMELSGRSVSQRTIVGLEAQLASRDAPVAGLEGALRKTYIKGCVCEDCTAVAVALAGKEVTRG